MNFKSPIGTGAAAKITGVYPELFRYYILKGLTPEYIKIGKFYFFEKEEIENWIRPDLPKGGYKPRKPKKRAKKC